MKRRQIKYKSVNVNETNQNTEDAFGNKKVVTISQPILENVSEQKENIQSTSRNGSQRKILITSNFDADKAKIKFKKTNRVPSSNYFLETFSTTFSSSKNQKMTTVNQPNIERRAESIKGTASRENSSDSKVNRSKTIHNHLRSNEIIKNIHSLKRDKRMQKDKFYKVKSCDDILDSPLKQLRSQMNSKVQYNWDVKNQFFANPIEMLRQERLKRETLRHQRIQKEKDKLKVIDHEDIR